MEITAEIITSFRGESAFQAFSDPVKWPDSFIESALCEGDAETGSKRWGGYADQCGNFKRRGMFYYAAAWLINNFGDGGPANAPGGEARLNVAGKSIGDESIQYRVPGILSATDDWLMYSHFGAQFARLRRRAGMGAVAV